MTYPFNKSEFRRINASVVGASKNVYLKPIESRLSAFQQAKGKSHMLPLSPQRVAQKRQFAVLRVKNDILSMKLCYKVSLC